MRYELSDYEWAVIRPMLPNKPRGVPRVDDRRTLNGIFWVLRSGAPWRDLAESYGPHTTCHNRTRLHSRSRTLAMKAARIGRGHRPFCSGGSCGSGPWALGWGSCRSRQRSNASAASISKPNLKRQRAGQRGERLTARRNVTPPVTPSTGSRLFAIWFSELDLDFIGGRTRTRTLDPLIKS